MKNLINSLINLVNRLIAKSVLVFPTGGVFIISTVLLHQALINQAADQPIAAIVFSILLSSLISFVPYLLADIFYGDILHNYRRRISKNAKFRVVHNEDRDKFYIQRLMWGSWVQIKQCDYYRTSDEWDTQISAEEYLKNFIRQRKQQKEVVVKLIKVEY